MSAALGSLESPKPRDYSSPLFHMTEGLSDFYNGINTKFYEKRESDKQNIYNIFSGATDILKSLELPLKFHDYYKNVKKIQETPYFKVYSAEIRILDNVQKVSIKIFNDVSDGKRNAAAEANLSVEDMSDKLYVAIYKTTDGRYAFVSKESKKEEKKLQNDLSKIMETVSRLKEEMESIQQELCCRLT